MGEAGAQGGVPVEPAAHPQPRVHEHAARPDRLDNAAATCSINDGLYKQSLNRPPSETSKPPVPSPARIRSTIATIAAPPEDLLRAAIVHKALADTTRLRIIARLAEDPATVSELIDLVDLSQPLVSWHLRRLKVAGLVETRRSGREVICTLSRDAIERFHEQEHAMLGMAV